MALVMVLLNQHWDFFCIAQHHRRMLRIRCASREMRCKKYNRISIYFQHPRANIDLLCASFDFYFENWPEDSRRFGQVSFPIQCTHRLELPLQLSTSVLEMFLLSYSSLGFPLTRGDDTLESPTSPTGPNSLSLSSSSTDTTSPTGPSGGTMAPATIPLSTMTAAAALASSVPAAAPTSEDLDGSPTPSPPMEHDLEGFLTIYNTSIDEILLPIPSLNTMIIKEICFRGFPRLRGECAVCTAEDVELCNVHPHDSSLSHSVHAFCLECLLQIQTTIDPLTEDTMVPCPLCRKNILHTCDREE